MQGSRPLGELPATADGVMGLVDALAVPTLALHWQPDAKPTGPLLVNAAFTRSFGYAGLDAVVADGIWSTLCRGDEAATEAQGQWQSALRALASGVPESFELDIVCQDGSPRHVLIQLSQVGDVLLTHLTDLTTAAVVARELIDDRNLLQRILDTSPSMIFVKDAAGRIRYVNQYTANYYGTTPDQLMQASTEDAHQVDEEAEQFVSDDQRVIRTGEAVDKDELNTAPDGSQHWFHTVKVPFTRSDGTVDVLGMATDVTARKQAETALRESEEKLRLAAAASGIGLWQWDILGDAIDWDDTTLKIFGLTRETLPRDRDTYLKCIYPEDVEKVTDAIRTALETGVYPPLEHKLVRPDGTVRVVLANATVTYTEDGRPAKFIGGVRDITEQRELDELRREAQKLEAIGQLSAGVAHNFNNMLTGIIPNIELALEDVPHHVTELLRAAQDSALRASELVSQLVTFAGRSQSGPRRVEDVRGLVRRVVDMCRRTFDRSIEIDASYPETEHMVHSAATELEQVLLNLLINARDAVTDPSVATPTISVTVDSAPPDTTALRRLGLATNAEYVLIRVQDNGVGISSANRERIFEPFYTTKEPGRGTGLGLSTTLTTVREHGGGVDCDSRPGAGSTFTVFLPRIQQEAKTKTVSTPPARGGDETILVIDDEEAVRQVVRKVLERSGYRVEVASSGQDGLLLLENSVLREAISLVIVDMSMPGIPGRVVCERLKQRYPELPVAYFTGYAVESLEGADGVIQKPITNRGLIRSVREILDARGAAKRTSS